MWSSLLIACSALDVRDETEIQNILKQTRKKGETRPNRAAGRIIVNVPLF